MNWRFIESGAMTGAANMSLDEELARALDSSPGDAILRLYGWSPPAISLGYHQELAHFDAPRAAAAGIDIVRRPTGGKAILHWHELTYAVVMPLAGTGPREIYRFVHEGLLRGLALLGIEAELAVVARLRRAFHDPASIPCFSTSAESELQVRGRKLVGSAQRKFGAVVLQHGSLLLGPEHRRIVEFLAPGLGDLHADIGTALRVHTIDASEILGRPVTFDEALRAIRAGFEEHCAAAIPDPPRSNPPQAGESAPVGGHPLTLSTLSQEP